MGLVLLIGCVYCSVLFPGDGCEIEFQGADPPVAIA